MPAGMARKPRDVSPSRLNPRVASARIGAANAGICVAGSMIRSGRNATQPHAATRISRASSATPGRVSVRSLHEPGDSDDPSDEPVSMARVQMTRTSVLMSAMAHDTRR